MLKYLRRLLPIMSHNNDDDTGDFPMMDQLAFDCQQLAADLAANAVNEDQNRLLAAYIERADRLHHPVEDFADDLDWFNVTEPLSTNGTLRGKIVILDFFTYCCINCLHVLPDLKRLEQLYTVADGLVVIGVHSAKFANEKDSSNILSAVQRHNITHPVVNDVACAMWQALDVKCWPTMVVLGPRAQPLFVLMGEGNYEQLEKYVGAAVKYYAMRSAEDGGGLSAHPLPLNPAIDLIVAGQLQFPGKVVCSRAALMADDCHDNDGGGEELYAIVDTGHHRVLVVNAAGMVLHRIGGKTSGYADGDFRTARFNGPQGVCFSRNAADGQWSLYVADTENHAIRRADLGTQTVQTVAGTGEQGNDRQGGRVGCEQPLSSPWDVVMVRMRNMDMSFHEDERTIPERDVLLIANAGLHQIWALFVEETIWWKFRRYAAGTVVALVGNGNEENRNNSYPMNAAFAQPSGLAWRPDEKELFVADSESSSVRKVHMLDGKVLPVVGGDRNPLNLFAYGNVDGKQFNAKLQHPLGVAFHPREQAVYVADTYNHLIKRIDLATGQCTTCTTFRAAAGDDEAVINGEPASTFYEPGGLCVSAEGAHLLVADTNNHRIVRVHLEKGECRNWRLCFDALHEADVADGEHTTGLTNPDTAATATTSTNGHKSGARATPPVRVARVLRLGDAGSFTSLKLTVEFPIGTQLKLTPEAPQRIEATVLNAAAVGVQTFADNFCASNPTVLLALGPTDAAAESSTVLMLVFRLNLCAGDVCFPHEFRVEVPMECGVRAEDRHELVAWRMLLRQGQEVEFAYDE